MFNKNIFGSLFLFFVLNSCFIVDQVIYDKQEYSENLSKKVKETIRAYIKTEFENQKYYQYGFTDLIIHKPIELSKLDSLKKVKPTSKTHQTEITEKINTIEKKIEQEKISYWFEMDHVFSIQSKNKNKVELYETTFYVNDTFYVKKIQPLVFLELTNQEESVYSIFFYETPIFKSESYYVSQDLSSQFYRYFKSELNRREGRKVKSEFLKHVLWICNEVQIKGEFNQKEILIKLTKNYFLKNEKITNYIPLKFSELFEIKEEGMLKNYYFFHKFSHSKKDSIVKNAVYVEFSPYYELSDVYLLEQPIEYYLNE